jgi:hypothetical protein
MLKSRAGLATIQISDREIALIGGIAERAVRLAEQCGYDLRAGMVILDLAQCHVVTPLDLALLLAAPDQDFAHDVYGIVGHLDRETGKLRDCFLPRTARIQHERA